MPEYRRMRVAGGTYFFTVKLRDPESHLLVEQIAVLREVFRAVRQAHPFTIDAIVIMPNHLHALWTLPPGDSDYSTRWRQIKAAFSRTIPKGERVSASRQSKGERGIWQRRFWEHTIRDQRGFNNRLDYIHHNPVKHRYVEHAGDWPYSSFHRAVRQGIYPAHWRADDSDPFELPPDEDA
ncbi:REP-associated tyrosine transposase [Thiocystis violacea]|uniref:REP-associated tyrosine transposase n=1 Tax=Thiocystis violacea TaxID=13725 RepID=UPI001907521F|nr:transposase [Thiocystis violacea]MBK1720561.1 transposase [Thiocystis violacea]